MINGQIYKRMNSHRLFCLEGLVPKERQNEKST